MTAVLVGKGDRPSGAEGLSASVQPASLSFHRKSRYVPGMGVPVALTIENARPASRRDEAFDFIRGYLVQHGHSPSMEDVRVALGVSKTRAKALVHQLATAKMIDRVPGAQRGISIPGLFRQLVLDELRREGYVIDKDVISEPPCPQGHLPLIAILEHVPGIIAGDHHDQSDDGGAASL